MEQECLCTEFICENQVTLIAVLVWSARFLVRPIARQEPHRAKLLLISYKGFRFLPILKSVKFEYITVVRKGVKQGPCCEHSWKHVAAEIRHTVGRDVIENLRLENVYPGVDVMAEDLVRGGLFQKTLNAALSIETNYAAGSVDLQIQQAAIVATLPRRTWKSTMSCSPHVL